MHNVGPQREPCVNYIETLRDQLQDMGQGFVEALPSLAIALIILLITWIVARFGVRISDMIVGRTERGDHMFVAMADRSAQMAADLDTAGALEHL